MANNKRYNKINCYNVDKHVMFNVKVIGKIVVFFCNALFNIDFMVLFHVKVHLIFFFA
jgi:hypothetical protein